MRTDVPIRDLLPELADRMRRYRKPGVSLDALGRQQPRGPNGRMRCRWCGSETSGRRRTFCSDACVDEYKLRSGVDFVRTKLWQRDHGVCALCGMAADRWEADHVVAVSEGGGMCGLDGLRTLCVECHKRRTAQQAAGRAGVQPDSTQLTLGL